MKRYAAAELNAFLLQLDKGLTEPTELLIIGGSAASLAYGYGGATTDVDTYNALTQDVENAVAAARSATGFDITVTQAGVAELPYHFDERVQPYALAGLTFLTIRVPERHDLVLSKLARGVEHDLQAVAALHRIEPLDCEVLITRYITEMFQAMGNSKVLDQQFLAGLEQLFSDQVDAADSDRRRS